jgi:hypothetical protein
MNLSVQSINLCESVVQTLSNAVGVYKNGKGLFDDENAALESGFGLTTLSSFNHLKLYPNPFDNNLIIEYNNGSTLVVYDVIGRQVKEVILPSNQNKVHITLNELSTGVYTYKQLINGVQSATGKLIKN